MKTMLIAMLFGAVACGGTDKVAPSKFAGTWTGQVQVLANAPFAQAPAPSQIEFSDLPNGGLRMTGFCPGATDPIDLAPEADTMEASNVVICPFAKIGTCDGTQLIVKLLYATNRADGSLGVTGAGWAIGCSTVSTVNRLFIAPRGK